MEAGGTFKEGEWQLTECWYPIPVKQKDKVSRLDGVLFQTAMHRAKRNFVASGFGSGGPCHFPLSMNLTSVAAAVKRRQTLPGPELAARSPAQLRRFRDSRCEVRFRRILSLARCPRGGILRHSFEMSRAWIDRLPPHEAGSASNFFTTVST
mgnify:CR=1 FL=1